MDEVNGNAASSKFIPLTCNESSIIPSVFVNSPAPQCSTNPASSSNQSSDSKGALKSTPQDKFPPEAFLPSDATSAPESLSNQPSETSDAPESSTPSKCSSAPEPYFNQSLVSLDGLVDPESSLPSNSNLALESSADQPTAPTDVSSEAPATTEPHQPPEAPAALEAPLNDPPAPPESFAATMLRGLADILIPRKLIQSILWGILPRLILNYLTPDENPVRVYIYAKRKLPS